MNISIQTRPPVDRTWIGVDWGTSSMRAALMNEATCLQERSNSNGILSVKPGGFADALNELCGDWLQRPDHALCLISGMAGSAQGWQITPYCNLPAGKSELTRQLQWVVKDRIALVPGLTTRHNSGPDVMRGEEVQILGALKLLGIADGRFVLPGSHSKWVQVKSERIEDFTTYMTGEVFAALRQHTLLARTLPPTSENQSFDEPSFNQAVELALKGGSLLNLIFSTRTLSLFDRATPLQLLSHLSGLVIGEEIRDQLHVSSQPVWVIGNDVLQERYSMALRVAGIDCQTLGSQATWCGLHALMKECLD
jgi:2-dehydro-3-deoxygalactonokinase